MELKQEPFPHIIIDDFLSEEEYFELIANLEEKDFFIKEADLFKMKQTIELEKDPAFTKTKEKLLSTNLSDFNTSSNNLTMSGTLYEDTDFLLCHDDQLEGRKVAFVLYLTDLENNQGGALRLYESKENLPTKITKKITPKKNRLVLFKVSPLSFHDVEEVINAQRLALGGWYV